MCLTITGVCTLRQVETVSVLERFFANQSSFEPLGGGFLGPISGSADAFFMFTAQRRDTVALSLMKSELRKIGKIDADASIPLS